MISWGRGIAVAAALLGATGVRAQQTEAQEPPPPRWSVDIGFINETRPEDRPDQREFLLTGGIHLEKKGLEIRAERGVMLVDHDDFREVIGGARREQAVGGLPRRGLLLPDPRRRVTMAVLRSRLQAFLGAARSSAASTSRSSPSPIPIHLMRHLYLEGNVVVLQDGQAAARADAVHFSTIDDRMVLRGAELRLVSMSRKGERRVLVVRGDKIVRQGVRTTGRDLSVTTCDAGEPHFEVLAGEAEILQRPGDFEIRTRDSDLVFSGRRLLPLPDTSFSLADQNQFLIQGASAAHSSTEGARATLDLGSSLNPLGGAVHESITGRPAHEFHGDWYTGFRYNQERGFPLEAGINYRAEGRYRGRIDVFYLDDEGRNRREIRSRPGGEVINETRRSLLRTENRFHVARNTSLDLTAFAGSDAAVYSEFFAGEYRTDEIPESSLHLRHANENRILTATLRDNLTSFSYDEDRSLAPAFTEELPGATFDWYSEPVADLPWGSSLLLTSSSGAAFLKRNFDRTTTTPDYETLRLDQSIELSAPFRFGHLGVRPFATARATHFDHTAVGGSDTRAAFEAGARVATWLARTWSWSDDDGGDQALRHVMSPAVAYLERFHVDGTPGEFLQFDEVDSLSESTEIRFEVLNRLQHRDAEGSVHEFLWLDLAQTLTPIADRDNAGHHLGLFEYELILIPRTGSIPLSNLLFLLEGEHDWNTNELRTFNTGLEFGKVLGLDWATEYRTHADFAGTVGYGAGTTVMGRWAVFGNSVYDLALNDTLNYSVSLSRQDHDWRITMALTFDAIGDETSFYVNFEPSFGGLFRPRRNYFVSRANQFGTLNTAGPGY